MVSINKKWLFNMFKTVDIRLKNIGKKMVK